MDRTCVILNPGSRSGGETDLLERLRPSLDGWEIRTTERAGHARELARSAAADGFATVIAAGGDGTINEVVNGLAAAAAAGRPRLGVLPLGTGNDLVRLLGLPPEPEDAAAVLRRGACRRLDLGEMRTGGARRFFLNVAAGGFAGEVDRALTPEIKRGWGPLAYLRAATEVLSEIDVYRVRARFDGLDGADGSEGAEEIELDALNVVVANGRFAGGGLPIAPRARPDDGLLDVVVIPQMPLTGLIALAPLVLTGRHLNGAAAEAEEDEEHDDARERIVFRRCRGVALESNPPMPWNNDGELIGELTPSFRVAAGALEVLVGASPLWEREAGEAAEAGSPVPWPSDPETAGGRAAQPRSSRRR